MGAEGAGPRRGRRRLHRLHRARRRREAARGHRPRPRRLDLSAGRLLRLCRDRRLRRPPRARGDGDDPRRRGGRAGGDQRLLRDCDRLGDGVLGDSTSFFIGRRLGRDFLRRHAPRVGVTEERLDQIDDYFARHGGKTIFLGRFIGFVRAFAPFVAGSSGMAYRGFVPYSVLGTGLWASRASSSATSSRAASTPSSITPAKAPSCSARSSSSWSARRRCAATSGSPRTASPRSAGWRATASPPGSSRSPALRAAAPVPLGPGHAGGDLRARVHLADGGACGRPLRADRLRGDHRRRPGADRRRRDRDGHRRKPADRLADRDRQGSDGTRRRIRRDADGGGLRGAARLRPPLGRGRGAAVGLAAIFIGVHEIKDAVDRPGPSGGLVGVDGSSFPSGHAAYSTFYVWLAVTIVLRLRPGWPAGRRGDGGFALAGLIGLSRVYLGVHYMSDVNAGWALGAACFSFCAAVALVITTVAAWFGTMASMTAASGSAEDRRRVPAVRHRRADHDRRLRRPDPRPCAQRLRPDLGEGGRRASSRWSSSPRSLSPG